MNVYLDGEFAFGLSVIVAAWLQVGQVLDETRIASLQRDEESETAFQKALHFLSYRPRSSEEVRRNLAKRGISEPLVEATLSRLQTAGLVNDQEFARAWVENRNAFRPRSRLALRTELRAKGLSDDVLQPVLDEQVDESALAFEAARKYVRRLAGCEWPQFRQKLGGFLARRGFSYSVLSPVVSEVWKEFRTADTGRTLHDED